MKREKIKLKYLMGIWKHLPNYPTSDDMIYEITSYLIKDGRPNGEFTFQTLNSVFGKGWEKTEVYQKIGQMIEKGEISRSEKKDNGKEWYKITENPYY
jgi:hypothetical protein